MFITFEGPEGAGKSSQIKLLASRMAENGKKVLTTREPGGTGLGGQLRSMVLSPEINVSLITEVLLYAADRAQHVAEVIVPAVEDGYIVLCDRHIDSFIAYQCFGRGVNYAFISELNRWAGTRPDITFLLDVPLEVSRQRMSSRGTLLDRVELEGDAFHERVRQGYLAIAEGEPDRVRVFDGTLDLNTLHEKIYQTIMSLLSSNSPL